MANNLIMESGRVAATSTDILAGTRLDVVPANGVLLLQFQADANDATNNHVVTVQLPSNEIPIQNGQIPCDAGATVGMLDDRQMLEASFNIQQGGKCLINITETGAAVTTWRAVFYPGRAV